MNGGREGGLSDAESKTGWDNEKTFRRDRGRWSLRPRAGEIGVRETRAAKCEAKHSMDHVGRAQPSRCELLR